MASTGRIMDIARRAMSAQRLGLETTGHNIANANTEGYSRQRVDFEAANPMFTTQGYLGQGVDVESIHRIRDDFIDVEIRSEYQSMKRWEEMEQYLGEIENVFNEPSDTGLSGAMREFWNAWNDLANDPLNGAARETVRQTGIFLTNNFNSLYERLASLRSNMNEQIRTEVDEINSTLNQISELNVKIAGTEQKGVVANEYRDRRTMLLKELSGKADITMTEHAEGMVTVALDGRILVERNKVFEMGLGYSSDGKEISLNPIWVEDQTSMTIRDGVLSGLIDVRDEVILGKLDELNDLAVAFVETVNDTHEQGYAKDGSTGNFFFDSNTTGASDIALDNRILNDIEKIAASTDGSLGDGNNALAIAQLEDSGVMEGGTSISDYFAAMIGKLGVETREATFMRENQELMVSKLENQQASISGVSLDEEMTQLIKYQHAFDAAARLISTIDEMMDTIIHMV